MARRTTLQDVASRVGVSTRTVSRVVNGEAGYSAETRQRILDAIDELGYRQNKMARALVTNQTDTLGLVVTFVGDPFFSDLADHVEAAAAAHGKALFITSSNNELERESEVLNSLLAHGADGIIIFPAGRRTTSLAPIADLGVPVVVLDHGQPEDVIAPNVTALSADVAAGAALGVRHLIETWGGPVGMLASTAARPWPHRRERGFQNGLAAAGVPEEGPMAHSAPTVDGGREAMATLLEQQPDVRGVLAYNDLMAIGAINCLTERGRRVPEDVAVVGFDDIALSEYVMPPLTTIRLPREQLAVRSVDRIIEMRTQPEVEFAPETFDVTLVHRASG